MRKSQINRKEINKLKKEISILKIELEEKYNDYYTVDIGYEYSRDNYGKSIESSRLLNIKQNILEDTSYLEERIRILEDRINIIKNRKKCDNAGIVQYVL